MARVARACRRVLALQARRPPRFEIGGAAKAVPRSLLAGSGFAVPNGGLGLVGPSCESSSSASSRGAIPAMALLRFSGTWTAWVGPACRRCGWRREPSSLSAVRLRHPGGPVWPRGCPVGRSRVTSLQSLPPARGRCRFVPAASPREVPRTAFPDTAAEPLQGLHPWAECLAVLEDRWLLSWVFPPLGRSPPAPWGPVSPGHLLLRASPPAPVGGVRRHPGVLRCAGSGLAVSGAGPSGVCDP